MFLFVLILLMITPAFSMEAADDPEFAEGIRRSLDPSYNVRPGHIYGVESDDEEATLQRAIAMSMQGLTAATPVSPFEALHQKGKTSSSEAEFLRGLDNKNASANLIGYLEFLKNKDKRRFEALMVNVDRAAWDSLYQKLALGKRTANNVFIHLDEVKNLIFKQKQASIAALMELVNQIDHVMLELLSGKWGFSRTKLAIDAKAKLKAAAVGIGRDLGNKAIVPERCAETIFKYFNKGQLGQTVSDPLLRKHRLAAFAYIANGYKQGLIPGHKDAFTTQLAAAVKPYFKPEDLKGFSLEALIQDPRDTLAKIAKVSTSSFAQQADFDKFVGPLRKTVAHADLMKLKAFMSTFEPDNIHEVLANEDQLNSLKLLQRALQDKTPQDIQVIINDLIENDFLPAQVRDIQDLLVEAAGYSAPSTIDRIYPLSMQTVRSAGKGDAEPLAGLKHEDFDVGLQLWILEYFKAIHENGYYPRDAYVVKYPGILDGRQFNSDDEITAAQAEKAWDHMAAYSAAKDLKKFIFPGLTINEIAIFTLTATGGKIDVRRDDGSLARTRDLNPSPGDQMDQQIAFIRRIVERYDIDPNVLPAAIEKKALPSKRPIKKEYAVRGGDGISDLQQIKSRGLAIDVLIKEEKIIRSLKLPILLYLNDW